MIFLRRVFVYFALYILVPILVLSGIEFLLRYKGYGNNLSPWVENSTPTGKVYTKNLIFYQQFFDSPVDPGEHEPYLTAITLPKLPNTIRIFVFGESAALGWPDAKYSFGKFLEVMLNRMYPQYRWEVFNICFAGVNSHILRYVAQESLFLQPDIVILYMGNNEAHGTFGLYHSFKDSVPLPDYVVQLQLRLQNFYLFQNMRNFAFKLRKIFPRYRSEIRYDDPRVGIVSKNYERNLHAMVKAFVKEGIPVFIGTLGSNLRDWPPQESWFRKDITERELENWRRAFEEGFQFFSNMQIEKAKGYFIEAQRIDASPAFLNFLLGWCYIFEEKYAEARKYFIEAREKDGFGFVRAKEFINYICEKVAKEYEPTGKVFFVPVENELSSNSFANSPGLEMFVDSCHFNFYGDYITACSYLKFIQNYFLRDKLTSATDKSIKLPSFDEVKKMLFIYEDDFYYTKFLQLSPSISSVIYYPQKLMTINICSEICALSEKYTRGEESRIFCDLSDLERAFLFFDLSMDHPDNFIFRYLETLQEFGAFRQSLKVLGKFGKKEVEDINYICLILDIYLALNLPQYYREIEHLIEKIENNYSNLNDLYIYYELRYLIVRNDLENAKGVIKDLLDLPFLHPSKKVFGECVQTYLNTDISYNEKLNRWREILERYSWSWDSFNFIVEIAKRDGKTDEVKKIFEELVNKGSNSPFPYLFLSFIYEDEGFYSKSIDLLKKASSMGFPSLALKYELARLLTMEGSELLKQGLNDEAIVLLEEAIRTFPYYLSSWVKLVYACELLGDEEGVLNVMRGMEDIQKKNIISHIWEIIF
ncbi:MAG: hypothetical protein N3G21_00140 [Candidatus Hydrogenedentes bacterium]|nr:hypothetical protein [Candidatus Hydrogenedentota bacterium]